MKKHLSVSCWLLLLTVILLPSFARAAVVNDPSWNITAVSDFNEDSVPEILWTNQATGDAVLWYLKGTSVIAEEKVINPSGHMWRLAGVGDFNGDGSPDILWRHRATGRVQIRHIDGSTVVGLDAVTMLGNPWNIAGIGDFNGDGSPDIVWRSSASWEIIVWFMRGTTLLGTAAIESLPPPWNIVGVGDFNGDGSPDILWRNSASGELIRWLMRGTAVMDVPLLAAGSSLSTVECIEDDGGFINSEVFWLYIKTLSAIHSPVYVSLYTSTRIYNFQIRAPPTFPNIA